MKEKEKDTIISVYKKDTPKEDVKIRPSSIDEFIGQNQIKERLKVFIEAAKGRGETIDHILFTGPQGLGKTTMAQIVANEMGGGIVATNGRSIEKLGDLVGMLTGLEEGDVFFIDEIHRLPRTYEEALYPAMEDYEVNIVIDSGPGAKPIILPLKPFTLIGATTRPGKLTGPLRDRFGIVIHFDFYSNEELSMIIARACRIMNIQYTNDGIDEIARRSRGTPRIALNLLRRVRDYAQVKGDGTINKDIAIHAMESMGIDDKGLGKLDRMIIESIIKHFNGGPVGIKNIAVAVGEDTETIEDVYEPYLIQIGFIKRTRQGRIALDAAYKHLGIKRITGGLFGEDSV